MTKKDSFAQRLATRRVEMAMSQSALARSSDIAVAQISRYESGKNIPRDDIIYKLAEALLVPYEWLKDGDTSLFDTGKAPTGELDVVISVPEELSLRLKEKAHKEGISPEDLIIKLLDISFESNAHNKDSSIDIDKLADKVAARLEKRSIKK